MQSSCVTSALCWMHKFGQQISIFQLFVTAYVWRHKYPHASTIMDDIKSFGAEGKVPFYVEQYLRKEIWSHLVYVEKHPQPRLIL